MSVFTSGHQRLALPLLAGLALCGCSTIDAGTQRIAQSITPYRMEIVQGNFVSAEQVRVLKPGLTRAQVKDLLGTPLVTSPFRADRWDYAFTLRRQGAEPQARKLTVYFKEDVLERFEGDAMPTEAEFVASLANLRKDIAVPLLEASEQAAKAVEPAAPKAAAPELPPLPASYPPLEAGASQ